MSWQAAYKDIFPKEFLDSLDAEKKAERFLQNYRTTKLNNTSYFYAIEEDSKPIGMLSLGKSKDEDMPLSGELNTIYLLPSVYGKGYGKQLMNFALFKLKGLGFSNVLLWAFEGNLQARRFYEKCGFILDKTQEELCHGYKLTLSGMSEKYKIFKY